MAQVNQRIGELDKSLQDYTQLVFDSRLSENEDTATVMRFTTGSSLASARHKRKGMICWRFLQLVSFLYVES